MQWSQRSFKAKSRSLHRCWLQLHSWIRSSFSVWHHSLGPLSFLRCIFHHVYLFVTVLYLCRDTQVSDCIHWSRPFIQTWLEKSLGCCLRLITRSCCTCWSHPSPCTQRCTSARCSTHRHYCSCRSDASPHVMSHLILCGSSEQNGDGAASCHSNDFHWRKKKNVWMRKWLDVWVNACLVLNERFLFRSGGWGDRCPTGSPGEGMLA